MQIREMIFQIEIEFKFTAVSNLQLSKLNSISFHILDLLKTLLGRRT